jgi:hypothetical protein
MQHDQAIREIEGALRRRVAVDVSVQIGARQRHDDRPLVVLLARDPHGLGAPPRVERDQDVVAPRAELRRDERGVPQLPQDALPAEGGDAVAEPRSRRRRADQSDTHDAAV